jgi:hypothetical protein
MFPHANPYLALSTPSGFSGQMDGRKETWDTYGNSAVETEDTHPMGDKAQESE